MFHKWTIIDITSSVVLQACTIHDFLWAIHLNQQLTCFLHRCHYFVQCFALSLLRLPLQNCAVSARQCPPETDQCDDMPGIALPCHWWLVHRKYLRKKQPCKRHYWIFCFGKQNPTVSACVSVTSLVYYVGKTVISCALKNN